MDALETWLPAQDLPRQNTDLRELAAFVRGKKIGMSSTANTTTTQPAVKRKREAIGEEEPDTQVAAMDEDAAPSGAPDLTRVRGESTHTAAVHASKAWKVAAVTRTSALRHKSASQSWSKKMEEKAKRKLQQQEAKEAREAYKDMLRQKREQHEAAKQRKEENRRKNDAAHGQRVSSAAARRMMKDKKQRKKLVAAQQECQPSTHRRPRFQRRSSLLVYPGSVVYPRSMYNVGE
eukprot:TRINITY_DN9229_c0_g2_i2.p1 TRINITY_DN9229_c0_g2~~TRINITY_DN9229_c0_g2_i2.p1  ORF type:complete len:234 (+),score=32.76 TRINITY_DN9229_c0_g2_i2:35-736(+)